MGNGPLLRDSLPSLYSTKFRFNRWKVDKHAVWKEFEQFYLDYCVGYWSPKRITLPYGDFLPLHPDEDASMLYGADLTRTSPQTVLDDIKALGKEMTIPIGFYISPSWKGDVDGFKAFLTEQGFHESRQMIPHVLDDFGKADALDHSCFEITPATDAKLTASIFQSVFRCSDDVSQLLVSHLEHRNFEHRTTQFFIARTKDGTPAGVAGCSYNHDFGYLHCLAVLEPYRRQGCATHLIKSRLNHLRQNNVRYAVTNVNSKNVRSLKTQEKVGYLPLTTVSVWKPNSVS